MKRRTIKVCMRLTEEEEVILRSAAKNSGLKTLSGFIRRCAVWHACNPATKIHYLLEEQAEEVIIQIKMLLSLAYKNPNPDDNKIKSAQNKIEAKIRSWLK